MADRVKAFFLRSWKMVDFNVEHVEKDFAYIHFLLGHRYTYFTGGDQKSLARIECNCGITYKDGIVSKNG